MTILINGNRTDVRASFTGTVHIYCTHLLYTVRECRSGTNFFVFFFLILLMMLMLFLQTLIFY